MLMSDLGWPFTRLSLLLLRRWWSVRKGFLLIVKIVFQLVEWLP